MMIRAGGRELMRGTALAHRGPNVGLRGRGNAAPRFVGGGNWMAARAASLHGSGVAPAFAYFIPVPVIPFPREATLLTTTTRSVVSSVTKPIMLKLSQSGVLENIDDG